MSSTQHPIAIVGVSALFPGSTDAAGFWRDILAGRDLIGDVPATHWRIEDYYDADPSAPDKTYARRGGFLSPVDFDALGFGLPPSILPATDTSQLLALIVAQQVLSDAARERVESIDRSRISVILGVTSAQELLFSMVSRLQRPVWERALREAGIAEDKVREACERIAAGYVPWQEASFPGLLGNVVAGRIANRLDLGGTNCVTDAACASSFSAIAMAVNELQLGHSDLVISGGVDTLNDIFMYLCFSKTPALSPTGDCRPFSDRADGTLLGEGLGMVALKRLADAERDGDRIYAVLKGLGTSSDGRSKSVYAPVSEGQANALRRAYEQAGYGPETVELMEAHGTGTKAGDAAEFEGLRLVFDADGSAPRQWCALGSVKSQIGHTKAAAGAAGLFKAVMALHHRVLPPTIKVDAPNPKLGIEASPFYLNTQARPWVRGPEHPCRASVSAFGFGGSNFHLTLEEYRGPGQRAERLPTHAQELVLLQGDSVAALRARAETLLEDTRPLAHVATDSRRDWNPAAAHRLALLAADADQLRARLQAALARIDADPARDFALPDGSSYGCGAFEGGIAVLFPGQGSQYPGMGADLAMQFEAAQRVWDAAAALDFDGERLPQRVFPIPAFDEGARKAQAERLTKTEWAQPALGAAAAAQWAVLSELGVAADAFAGHSFGELMALHAAGAFDLDTALRLARRRGEHMRAASAAPGAMLALSQPAARVRELLGQHPQLVLANHNAPTQVVVSGPLPAIEVFESALQTEGLASKRLPVATAFHSSLVAPAAEGLARDLADAALAGPAHPVYANASAAPYPTAPDAVRAQLAQQLAEPVRFVEMVEAMYAAGIRSFLEVGAGSVLTGLVGAILGERPHRAIGFDRRGRNGVESLLLGLARLAAAGAPLKPEALFADVRLPPIPKPLKLAVPICGSNLGKPYPPADPGDWPAPNAAECELEAVRQGAPYECVSQAPGARPSASLDSLSPARGGEGWGEGASPSPAAVFDPLPAATHSPSDPTHTEHHAMPLDPNAANAWLAVFAEHQRQTAEAQAAFQKALAESHAAYLNLAGASLAGLQGLMQGVPGNGASLPLPTYPAAPPTTFAGTTPAAQTMPAAPAVPAIPTASGALPAAASIPTRVPAQAAGPVTTQPAQVSAPAPALASAPALAPALASASAIPDSRIPIPGSPAIPDSRIPNPGSTANPGLSDLLLAVVAEKTGYPVDMLNLDMDLEGDLGVDSIKRVEILAAVEERAPGLPKPDRARLGALHTLREILEHLGGSEPGIGIRESGIAGEPGIGIRDSGIARAEASALPALLLAVVAEKTGYPVDMLNLDMDLEGDLGVDSIKRVEILAAVEERAPGLPKPDRARLGALHTLREILQHLGGEEPGIGIRDSGFAKEPGFGSRDSGFVEARAEAGALPALLLTVVAEKTGYPVDMLNLDMDLEGDLGVDSIKRVEILAAVEERAPGLPKPDRARLGALHTLREILDHLSGEPVGAAAPSPHPETPLLNESQPSEAKAQAAQPPLPRSGRIPNPESRLSNDSRLLSRYTVDPIHTPATGFSMPLLGSGERIWVIGEESIAAALVMELRRRKVNAQAAARLPESAQACIHLGALAAPASREAAMAVNREAFAIARQLAPNLANKPGLFVTVQDTGGAFGFEAGPTHSEWLAGLPALLKTCALEWPQAALKAIDIEQGGRSEADIATAIADELLGGGGEIEVGLAADGRRRSLRCVANAANDDSAVIEAGDVVVVSGGARGVTAACLIEWARAAQPCFVLLGRSRLQDEPAQVADIADEAGLKQALLAAARAAGRQPTPPELQAEVAQVLAGREIRATLEALRAAGSKAHYLSAPVEDAAALGETLDSVRRDIGPIRGLIHAAGVLADKRIAEKTDAMFDRVFDTKVRGLAALLDATAKDPLKLLAVFSSVSARCGNTGQADYAMANEVLARVMHAQARQRPGLRVKSLGWGPWEGGMVSPALKARFAELGVPMIPLAEGARLFAQELRDAGAIELVLGGEPRPEALLSDGADGRVEALELVVRRDSHGYLEGHALNGEPVVPVVLAAEWLTRAARSLRPGRHVQALLDLKVLKGIRLHGFENGGDRLRIEARPVPGSQGRELSLSIRSPGGTPHYSARAVLGDAPPQPGAHVAAPSLQPWSGGPLYGELLFHRQSFELIDSLDGISDEGVAATVRGVQAANWPAEDWQLDVAALDAGLQTAVLYGRRMLGSANLPTAIGELRSFAAPASGTIRVSARRRQVGASATTTDILLSDASGQPVAELIGVTNHAF